MNAIFYILIVIGAIMVYGAFGILKIFGMENSIKGVIILKLLGLAIALVGMLKILKVY